MAHPFRLKRRLPAMRDSAGEAAHVPLTRLAHETLKNRILPGDLAVDATAGNGHDTLFLAQAVGRQGQVYALDVQEAALRATEQRLEAAGLLERATLIQGGHEHWARLLPPNLRGRIAVVMFNLGYLPGSDKSLSTQADTTVQALVEAAEWLRPGGLLSVLVYLGHAQGPREASAVAGWLTELESRGHGWRVATHEVPGKPEAPRWHLVTAPGD